MRHDEPPKSSSCVRAWGSGRYGRRDSRSGTSLWRRLRTNGATGSNLRNGSVRAGPGILLGAWILDLGRLPLCLASRLLRLSAVFGREMGTGTLGAWPVRLLLEAGPLVTPLLLK